MIQRQMNFGFAVGQTYHGVVHHWCRGGGSGTAAAAAAAVAAFVGRSRLGFYFSFNDGHDDLAFCTGTDRIV